MVRKYFNKRDGITHTFSYARKLNENQINSRRNIYEKIEETMEEMNKEGWEVVCMSPEPQSHTFKMLVTFCREKQ